MINHLLLNHYPQNPSHADGCTRSDGPRYASDSAGGLDHLL